MSALNLDFDSPEWRDEMVDELKLRLSASPDVRERRDLWDLIKMLCEGSRKAKERQEARASA